MSQKDKAATAQAALLQQSLAVIDSSQVKASINIEKKQEQAVAVLTQKDDGTFDVHCIVHSTTAVNAALAAYFNANKSELQQVVAQQKAIEVAAQQAALIATAANAANDINATAAA
jgi:molybdopterin-guanine dinucleotide biosynthesis protein A